MSTRLFSRTNLKSLSTSLLVAGLVLVSTALASHHTNPVPRGPFTEGTLRALDTAKIVTRAKARPASETTTLTTGTYDYTYGNSGSPLTNLVATWNNSAPVSSLPWVVVVHGGTWSAGDNVVNESTASKMFATHGFATFNIDYRLLPNVTGAQQEADVLAAVNYVRAHWGTFKVDPNKGALYGFSAGGHLAALIGLSHPGLVKAIVTVSGVLQPQRMASDALGMRPDTEAGSTWMTYGLSRENEWTGCDYTTISTDPACAASWAAFEPQTYITATSAPMQIWHGADDTTIWPEEATAFNYWMRHAGASSTVTIVPGYQHDERMITANTPNAQTLLKFLVAKLGGGTW